MSKIWTLPNGDGTSGQVLSTDGTGALVWKTDADSLGDITSVSTGSGIGGGQSSGSVNLTVGAGTGLLATADGLQFNYSNTLATDPSLTAGQVVFDSADPAGSNQGGILFEGSVNDANEGLLTPAPLTADQTWTLPDISGNIALTSSNVATATALAVNVTNCLDGQVPLGVDTLGNAEGCVAAGSGTVTSVDSGAGLTGGPVVAVGSLAIGAGTGIQVNVDDVQLNYTATLAGNPIL